MCFIAWGSAIGRQKQGFSKLPGKARFCRKAWEHGTSWVGNPGCVIWNQEKVFILS